MPRNPYHELVAFARAFRGAPFAVAAANIARDLWEAGQREAAAGHARLCRLELGYQAHATGAELELGRVAG